MRADLILDALVAAMRGGEWTEGSVLARCAQAVQPMPTDAILAVAAVVHDTPAGATGDRLREDLARALRVAARDAIDEETDEHEAPLDEGEDDLADGAPLGGGLAFPTWLFAKSRIHRYFLEPEATPHLTARMPAAATLTDLAVMIGVEVSDAMRFASSRRDDHLPLDSPARDYRARWVEKRRGGARLIEAPKPRLARMQRRLLDRMLVGLPVHDAADGFVRGRSALDHARIHEGSDVVLLLDLEDFFGSISRARVAGLLHAIGYGRTLAREVATLVTTRTPAAMIALHPGGPLPHAHVRRLRDPHLPQGAPSSPVVANAVARFLDARLTGLAASLGLRYSRYADDLAFSGPRSFHRRVDSFATEVAAIAIDEGFRVQHRKTRVLSSAQRQRITGYVVNERAQVSRRERDRLEAILVNCVRRGAAAQNRGAVPDFAAHLRGRIAHVAEAHRAHAEHLEALYAAIDFGATPGPSPSAGD